MTKRKSGQMFDDEHDTLTLEQWKRREEGIGSGAAAVNVCPVRYSSGEFIAGVRLA